MMHNDVHAVNCHASCTDELTTLDVRKDSSRELFRWFIYRSVDPTIWTAATTSNQYSGCDVHFHRLNGSSSPVLTATSLSYVRDICEIFASIGGFRGWAIECC